MHALFADGRKGHANITEELGLSCEQKVLPQSPTGTPIPDDLFGGRSGEGFG